MLTIQEVREMFIYLSDRMISSKDLLTQADKVIGDGDHGIGMAKGFESVRQKIEEREFADLSDLFKTVGFSLMTSAGGASGAIFGTLYQGASMHMNGRKEFNSEALSRFLVHGLEAVKKRGKSKPGNKTMVDALEPAAEESRKQVSASLEKALIAVTEAARLGMENTKGMVASVGRAKSLGDRSLGHPDPGAISTHLILSYMTEFVARNNS